MDAEYAIIGGGVVGLSVAWGLLKRGRRVLVIDGGDGDLRASRGNFGLVWVQSKGLKQPAYARWTRRSAAAWADFADELGEATGADLVLRQQGGYDYHLDDATLHARAEAYEGLKQALGGDYPFEILGPNALKCEEPHVGPKVAGAILHHQDGHVNPLRLLHSLSADVRRMGATVLTGRQVRDVATSDGFRLTLDDGAHVQAARVVICAGLGAAALGPKFGFKAPVRPQRGQVLITEKLPRLMNRPSGIIRQVDEGGVQIGDSQEEVGYDNGATLPVIAAMAARAVAVFPALERAQMVRAWGALRIMSPDGLPIYQQSRSMPGAWLVTCHSGITLAAAHARFLPDWLEGSDAAPDLEFFGEDRFALS